MLTEEAWHRISSSCEVQNSTWRVLLVLWLKEQRSQEVETEHSKKEMAGLQRIHFFVFELSVIETECLHAWQMEHWVIPLGGWQLWLIWIYIKPLRAMLLLPWKHTLSWSRPDGLIPAGWMLVAGQELVQYCRPKNVLLERSHDSWSWIDAFLKGLQESTTSADGKTSNSASPRFQTHNFLL